MAAKRARARSPAGPLGRRSADILVSLRRDLDEGTFAEGAALPGERVLCERFGASRPTVRKAVARLVEEGRLEVRHGAGTFVRARPTRQAPSKTVSVMAMYKEDMLAKVQEYVLEKKHLLCAFSQLQQHWRPSLERLFLQRVLEERHKALVAFCTPYKPGNEDLLRELESEGVRVIHVEWFGEEPPEQAYLMADYVKAGHVAAMELMLAGYDDVRVVGFTDDSPYTRLLERGVVEAHREHNRRYDVERARFRFSADGFYLERKGYARSRREVTAFLRRLSPSTGIVCVSDEIARVMAECADECGVGGELGDRLIAHAMREPEAPGRFGVVYVDNHDLVLRAIDEATASAWRRPQELVAPTLVRPKGRKRG